MASKVCNINNTDQPNQGAILSVFQCKHLAPPFSKRADLTIGRRLKGDTDDYPSGDVLSKEYEEYDHDPYFRKVADEVERAIEKLGLESDEDKERARENLTAVHRSFPSFFEHINPREPRRTRKTNQTTLDNIPDFLQGDLDLTRLNDIHDLLWMAGRPLITRALHRQKLIGREIIPTEQMDLHMLGDEDMIFVRPLPFYYLSHGFWRARLCGKDIPLYSAACGFLLSYDWLIRSESDFHLAKELRLLPVTEPPIEWVHWQRFIVSFRTHINSDHRTFGWVNMRYLFGELRLKRINTIYRLMPRFGLKHFVRGYLYGYNRYTQFFQRRIAWMLILFVLMELVLSGMDVGLSVDRLVETPAFVNAAYGFSIFAMVLVAVVLAYLFIMFSSMYLINMVLAIRHSRSFAHQDITDYETNNCVQGENENEN